MVRRYKLVHLPRILKMNLLNGLYFPGTGLKKDLFSSLNCLFGRIDYYLLFEEDAADKANDKDDRWEGRVVLPLGDDRKRFMAMISDIRTHVGEYYESCMADLSARSPTSSMPPIFVMTRLCGMLSGFSRRSTTF